MPTYDYFVKEIWKVTAPFAVQYYLAAALFSVYVGKWKLHCRKKKFLTIATFQYILYLF